MVIGCVSDAPAPVLEIVSGADVTTEVSVVGNAPGDAAGDAAGAAVVATTDVSSVGNCGGGLAAGDAEGKAAAPAIGDGSALAGAFSWFILSIFAC